MSTPLDKLRISQLSLHNPGRMSDEEVVASFAARHALFERVLADLRAEKPRGRPQHHLIVGQRGMGKSLLLARLGAELRRDHDLAAVFIPLIFAEEQYAVDRLSKFWLNCLDSLADACERAGDAAATDRIDALVHRLSAPSGSSAPAGNGAAAEPLNALLAEVKALKRRPVLLVDNLQIVFERISDQEQHVLRELLMRPGAPILIGTSPYPPSAHQDYGAAFYDHFKVHYLPALSVEEMRQLLLTLAAKVERPDIRDRVLRHPHRLSVLRQLTGGNPRTAVTLFFLYAEDFAPTVFGDLENLLDRVTPLYKARFEELSPQQQVVASSVANHWDPITTRAIADRTSLAPTAVSPQLDRLEKLGFVERVELFGESSFGYQIAERFFNVWFLMRTASRRQRREVEFLTRFIEAFYEGQDRSRLARQLQAERDFSPDRHLFMRALVCTLDPAEAHDLRRHADLDALRQKDSQLRRRLAEIIDFTLLPPATLAFAELREKLVALVPPDAGVEPEDFARKVLGDRRMFVSGDRERLATRGQLSVSELQTLLGTLEKSRKADEARFGREAVDWLSHRLWSGLLALPDSDDDWEAAFVQAPNPLAIRLLLRLLPQSVGIRIQQELTMRLQQHLQPSEAASAVAWHNWGFFQAEFLNQPKVSELAFRQAVAMDQTDGRLWSELGRVLHQLERDDEAEAAYRRGIALDPREVGCWNNLGILLGRRGRDTEAEQAFHEASRLEPENAAPWNNLGYLLGELGRSEEAEAAFRTAIKVDSTDPRLRRSLAGLLWKLGRNREAESAHREAIALDPKDADLRKSLGHFLGRLGHHEAALTVFREATALKPDDADLWALLGFSLGELGQLEEAEAVYRRAIALAPRLSGPWNNLGIILMRLGRLAEAETALRRAIELQPQAGGPWSNLGTLLQSVGRDAEAETAYRQAAALEPKVAGHWSNLGSLLARRDHNAKAADAYREALARDQKDPASLLGLGDLCTDFLRLHEEAERAFAERMELAGYEEAALQSLISLRRDFCGDVQAAKPLLERLSQLKERRGEDLYHLHRGISAAYESDWPSACREFAQALDLARDGIPPLTTIGWMRTSAVLIHLNLGEPFLAFLRERGDDLRLRPWYEALAALQAGDRRHLQNVAPEIRPIAEAYFDQIEQRLNNLPEPTRRRPVPVPPRARRRPGRKRRINR